MINVQNVLKVLKNTMPKASEPQLMEAIKKFAKEFPDVNDAQFLAAMQQYMKTKQQSQPPFQGLINRLPTGVR